MRPCNLNDARLTSSQCKIKRQRGIGEEKFWMDEFFTNFFLCLKIETNFLHFRNKTFKEHFGARLVPSGANSSKYNLTDIHVS